MLDPELILTRKSATGLDCERFHSLNLFPQIHFKIIRFILFSSLISGRFHYRNTVRIPEFSHPSYISKSP
jgi:hypothetical protein